MDSQYLKYYNRQIGSGGGGGLSDFGQLYRYTPRLQKGRGIGSIFSGLLRFLKPAFFSGLNAIKNEAIKTGGDILQNLGSAPIGQLLRERGLEGVQNLTEKAAEKLKSMRGSGRGRGVCSRIKGKKCIKGRKSKRSKQSGGRKRKAYTKKSRTKAGRVGKCKSGKRKSYRKNTKQNKVRVLDVFG